MVPVPLAFLPNLGMAELLVLAFGFLFMVVPWGIAIWALVDAASRHDKDWNAIGLSRVNWILLIVLPALFCGPVSLATSVYYLAAIRPQLAGRTPPLR